MQGKTLQSNLRLRDSRGIRPKAWTDPISQARGWRLQSRRSPLFPLILTSISTSSHWNCPAKLRLSTKKSLPKAMASLLMMSNALNSFRRPQIIKKLSWFGTWRPVTRNSISSHRPPMDFPCPCCLPMQSVLIALSWSLAALADTFSVHPYNAVGATYSVRSIKKSLSSTLGVNTTRRTIYSASMRKLYVTASKENQREPYKSVTTLGKSWKSSMIRMPYRNSESYIRARKSEAATIS